MLSVIPIDVPEKVDIPTVALVGTDVKISWTPPDAHSSPITEYEILIKKNDGSYAEDATNCDGTGAIVTNAYCTLAMTDVQTFTSQAVDALIQVKVRA